MIGEWREYWKAAPDEEAIERIRRDLGVDEVRARLVLRHVRGEPAGDASINLAVEGLLAGATGEERGGAA